MQFWITLSITVVDQLSGIIYFSSHKKNPNRMKSLYVSQNTNSLSLLMTEYRNTATDFTAKHDLTIARSVTEETFKQQWNKH